MPVVNFDRMVQAMLEDKGRVQPDRLLIRLFDWKNQTLTPDPDTVVMDMLRSIGIEKGKPDAKAQKTLNAATSETDTWLNVR
jgi:hypothetical protein